VPKLLGTVYLRTTSRRRKDGSVVRYLQLAHNEWDAKAGQAKAKVLYSFGREDALDRAAIARMIASLARALEPGEALAAAAAPELLFLDSRPMGGAYLLDGLWCRLGIDATLLRLLAGRRLDARAERVLFALVANRALEPLSKLAAAAWVEVRVAISGLEELDDGACYRAMDFLLEVEAELAEAVYWATADLLNLEVDLLFFDTTSTYFEIDEPDPGPRAARAKERAARGARAKGGREASRSNSRSARQGDLRDSVLRGPPARRAHGARMG